MSSNRLKIIGILIAVFIALGGVGSYFVFNPRTDSRTMTVTPYVTTVTGIESFTARYEGALIDAHTHLMPGLDVDSLISQMDKAGVSRVVLMPREGATDQMSLSFASKYPNRIIPFVGFQNVRWVKEQDPNFPSYVEDQLKTGRFSGLGEVILRHYGVPERDAGSYDIPADSPLTLQIVDLAAKYAVPMTIHLEAEEKTIPALETMLDHNRNASIIWAHHGRSDPDTLVRLLEKHPNLYCDISAMHPLVQYGKEKNPITNAEGHLLEKWKRVYETFNERFVFGVDLVFLDTLPKYVEWIQAYRRILGELTIESAEKIAYKNIQKLITVGMTR